MYRIVLLLLFGCYQSGDGSKRTVAGTLDRAEAAAKAAPKDANAQYQWGQVALGERKNDIAEEAFTACLTIDPKHARALDERGDARLKLGKFKESVADFDAFLKVEPKAGPHHWRRGIALYYAGQYAEGAKQFESHKAVNPEDVENAAWHFLCVARDKGVAEARKGLIEVSADGRVPMAEVQKMFAGKATADDVLAVAGKVKDGTELGKSARFYGHLYVGLYSEATGDAKKAKEHITTAAEKYAVGHYMWDVAAAHAKTFEK